MGMRRKREREPGSVNEEKAGGGKDRGTAWQTEKEGSRGTASQAGGEGRESRGREEDESVEEYEEEHEETEVEAQLARQAGGGS